MDNVVSIKLKLESVLSDIGENKSMYTIPTTLYKNVFVKFTV